MFTNIVLLIWHSRVTIIHYFIETYFVDFILIPREIILSSTIDTCALHVILYGKTNAHYGSNQRQQFVYKNEYVANGTIID